MAELKKYLNERGLREVWDIINGQNSLIVSKIKDIQKRATVGLYADSTSGWAENESKISEAGALYIYTDAMTFNGKVIAKVKIGDGTSSLADLSFIDAPYSAHIADKDIHLTAEERAKWNDEISAFVTAAEEFANTAGEAANRAETAKTSAETSATQASASAQQTTANKTATAGYAQTAKTNADSTAADRQAVQTFVTQVTADKAIVADHAAQVAEDRTAAETAAQTAQAVADSLPEDYTTAVGKIAENTAEIANVKLTDKELQRRVNALYDLGNGITHQFETDSDTAYAKTIPTGAKLMSVKSIGGHSEVIDGEIVSAGTEEVVEQGKNLFDYTDKTYHGANVNKVENGVIYTKGLTTTALNIPTIAENKYTLSFKVKSNAANQGGLRWSLQKGKNTSYAHDSSLIKSEVGYAANTEYQAVVTFVADTDFVSLCTIVGMIYDVQLENGDTATNYSPFYQTAYQIPEAIRNLPGYGWSAGTARNYVDYENKRYVQCVSSVDLGTLSWRVGDSVSFETFQLKGQKLTKNYDIAPNILCSKYPAKTQNELWGKTNVTGITTNANVDGCVHVNDTSYTDATAFKQAMSGVILYYELANPIVTDISSLIPDDFLRNIEVEAGGSVTFKNSNDSYLIPVPSEEEYIVKLSEVGGTT